MGHRLVATSDSPTPPSFSIDPRRPTHPSSHFVGVLLSLVSKPIFKSKYVYLNLVPFFFIRVACVGRAWGGSTEHYFTRTLLSSLGFVACQYSGDSYTTLWNVVYVGILKIFTLYKTLGSQVYDKKPE